MDIGQMKRSPFITGFRADWKTFAIVNLHFHPGEGPDGISFRKEEVHQPQAFDWIWSFLE